MKPWLTLARCESGSDSALPRVVYPTLGMLPRGLTPMVAKWA